MFDLLLPGGGEEKGEVAEGKGCSSKACGISRVGFMDNRDLGSLHLRVLLLCFCLAREEKKYHEE